MACYISQFSSWYPFNLARIHTFHFTVLADIGRTLRTLGSGVTLLVANTARSLEHTRLGAFGLVVTDSVQQLSKAQERKEKKILTPPRHS